MSHKISHLYYFELNPRFSCSLNVTSSVTTNKLYLIHFGVCLFVCDFSHVSCLIELWYNMGVIRVIINNSQLL
jgi:hypothetical protein